MGNPLVSFIVPAYNVENYVERCLDRLLEEREVSFEVIVIDDGSVDSTGTILDMRAAKDPRLKIVHTENHGQGSARNLGMSLARGTYLFFHDADDYVLWDGIKRLITIAESGDYELVNGSYARSVNGEIHTEGSGIPEGDFSRLGSESERQRFHAIKTQNAFGYCTNKLYARTFLEKSGITFGNMKEIALEDQIFNCMLYASNPRSCFVNAPLFVYVIHDDSSSKQVDPTLPRRLSKAMEVYVDFLEERGQYAQNTDILVPLAMRSFAWAGFSAMRVEGASRSSIAAELRHFLDKPYMKRLLSNKENRRELKTIDSLAQRVAFRFFYDTASWLNGSFDAFVFQLGAPVMRKYVKAVVK